MRSRKKTYLESTDAGRNENFPSPAGNPAEIMNIIPDHLLDNLPGFVYRCKFDRNWTMLYISGGCKQITGYAPEELIENRVVAFNDLILPKYRDYLWEKWHSIDRLKTYFEEEYEIQTRSGDIRWVWEKGRIIYDQEGKIEFLDGLIVDITERKRSEIALAMEEQRFRTIAEFSPVPIFIQVDGQFAYLNPSARRVFDVTIPEEILGKDVIRWFHPDEQEIIKSLLHRLNVEQQPISEPLEIRMLRSDGNLFYADLWAEPIHYQGKNGSLVFFNDVTLRRQHAEALHKANLIFQHALDLMAIIDFQGNLKFFNPAWKRSLEYTDEELRSTLFIDLCHPDDRHQIRNVFTLLQSGKEIYHFETRLLTRPGSFRWFSWTAIPYIREENIVVIGRDTSERKQFEQELANKEQRFRKMVQHGRDIIALVSSDGRLNYISPAIEKTLGYKPEELLGQNGHKLVYPEDLPIIRSTVLKFLSTKENEYLSLTLRVLHKNGTLRWMDTTLTNLLDEPGIRAIIANSYDITDHQRYAQRKEIEARIARAVLSDENTQEFFSLMHTEIKKIIDVSRFGIYTHDHRNDHLVCEYLTHYSQTSPVSLPVYGSLQGMLMQKKVPLLLRKEEILQLAADHHIQLNEPVAECCISIPLMAKDRFIGLMVIENFSNPLAFEQEDVELSELLGYYLSTFLNRKEIELINQKLYKAVILNPASILITDSNGNIEYVNPKFTELTGYSSEEVLGKNPRILQSGYQSREFYQNLWQTILSGEVWQGELLNRKKNGDLYWVNAVITPVIADNGRITHFIGVKEDITPLKKLLNDLIESKRKAEESDRIKTEFINNISHEIRTPLNAILGIGQMIIQSEISESERDLCTHILQSSIQRLLNTINDYMDASLLAADAMKVKQSGFTVKNFIESILAEVRNDFLAKNINLSLDTENLPADLVIYTDEELLKKVFQKLLSNALKFTEKGRVKVGGKLHEDRIYFYLEDTGIGISEEDQKKLFKTFSQVYTGSNRRYEGSGLGLFIAKNILHLLGGEITVSSVSGKGSRFEFSIPVGFKPGLELSRTEVDGIHPQTVTILVAEDDDHSYYYLNTVLKKFNVTMLRATNGQEAVNLCREHTEINMVLMDIKMPLLDGMEALKEIRSFRPNLPIVAITAYALTGDEEKFRAAGFNEYISKPATREMIIQVLKKAGLVLQLRESIQ